MELHTSGNEKPSSGTENRVDEKKTKSDFVKGKEHSTRTHLSIGYPFISGSNRVIMANDAGITSVGDRETKRGRWQLGQLEIRPSESWISATWELSHFTPSALEY